MPYPFLKTPVDDDGEKKPTRHYSDKQEKSVAKAVGGKKTPNSGATMYVKGDVLTKDCCFECKTIEKHQKTRTIEEVWFTKNKDEALYMNKSYDAVVINFGEDRPNYYCIDEALFKRMKYALELLDQQESEEDN